MHLNEIQRPMATAQRNQPNARDRALKTVTPPPKSVPAPRGSKPALVASDAASHPTPQQCTQALALIEDCPGVGACALVDRYHDTLIAQAGAPELARSSASAAGRLWTAYESDPDSSSAVSALGELTWTAGAHQHLALPLQHRPGLWLLAVIDREFGDLAQVRWQLAVARNHLD